MSKGRKLRICKYILIGISVITWVAAISIIILNSRYQIAHVISSSMEPALKVGDYVIVKEAKAVDCKRGDIVVYRNEQSGMRIIHRVISTSAYIDGYTYRKFLYTKGDANAFEDEQRVTDEHDIRKVIVMPSEKINKVLSKVDVVLGTPLINFIFKSILASLLAIGPLMIEIEDKRRRNEQVEVRQLLVIDEEGINQNE